MNTKLPGGEISAKKKWETSDNNSNVYWVIRFRHDRVFALPAMAACVMDNHEVNN